MSLEKEFNGPFVVIIDKFSSDEGVVTLEKMRRANLFV